MARRRPPAPELVKDTLAEIRKHARAAQRHERALEAALEQRNAAIVAALNEPLERRPTQAQVAEAAGIISSGIPSLLQKYEARRTRENGA